MTYDVSTRQLDLTSLESKSPGFSHSTPLNTNPPKEERGVKLSRVVKRTPVHKG